MLRGHPLWPRWVDERAFFKRHFGDYRGAIADYEHLGAELAAELKPSEAAASGGAPRPELVWEFVRASCHAVEARLLLASDRGVPDRASLVEPRGRVLSECRRWLAPAPTVPARDAAFFEGELALFWGQWDAACAGYQAYVREAARWEAGNEQIIADVRIAAAQAAAGRHAPALRAWSRGLQASLRKRSLAHTAQYLVGHLSCSGNPLIFGGHGAWPPMHTGATNG